MLTLPIDSLLPEIVQKLAENACLVLQASPGSGKTTRVPPALLKAAFVEASQEVWVLEPRRVAAKFAARRVAEELGERVGESVGYQFRFENVSGPRTRLRFFTEGMLMRRLLGDPTLSKARVVVLDEFHERHLHSDLALAYLRWLQTHGREDLKILVMSATLETEALSRFLGDCPVIRFEGRMHPVTTEYLPGPAAKPLDVLVKDAVLRSLRESPRGDILVFLPGMGEIRRAEAALGAVSGARVLPLHGELTREEQDHAIEKADFRKVILSTNVAETSLTIEGVTTVIDSGLHRVASYSFWSGIPALKTRPISKASAIQRAGRAGRTGPGRCLRLFTQWEFESRAPFDVPEIQRADLTQTMLELSSLEAVDSEAFRWLQPPSSGAIDSARELLRRLGALDDKRRLTERGRQMSALPAHPRLARICLEALERGGTRLAEQAATLAALIGEGRLDALDLLDNLAGAESDAGIRRARSQLLGALPKKAGSAGSLKGDDALRFCVLTGFPDRVARKRKLPSHSNRGKQDEVELVFSSGGSSRVEEKGVLAHAEEFVTLDIQETQGLGQTKAQLRVRCVSPIQPEWLFDLEPSGLREIDELTWDAQAQQVFRLSRMSYDELTLTESRGRPEERDADAAADVLLRQGLGLDPSAAIGLPEWIAALGKVGDAAAITNALARAALLWKHLPPGGDPVRELWSKLRPLFSGKRSLAELREIDWAQELLVALLPEHAAQIERLVPSHLTLPGGRRLAINYAFDQPPWAESRMQDFFGMKRGPSILGGKLPVTLHLLAPNYRAVQVTTDLEGFWERGYQELRNQLSRRYPRHFWPESPLEAEPPPPRGKR